MTHPERLLFVLLIPLFLLVSWQVFDRTPATNILRASALGPVSPGGELWVMLAVDRQRLCATEVETQIRDSKGHVISSPLRFYPSGFGRLGRDEYAVSRDIPSWAASGKASILFVVRWRCPLNAVQLIWPISERVGPVPFDILPLTR